MAAIKLLVNGNERKVDVDPKTPLLWVLRDELQLTGTRYACGIGVCGACMVLIDGKPFQACSTLVDMAVGKAVTTVEGLSKDRSHPLQQAWLSEEVSQCGYCQSGQLIAAAALLAKHPKPTNEQIDDAMTSVLCRCGTYPRIRKAIHAATKLQGKGG